MSCYVLGLDLGPNSIGWAMINADEDGNVTEGFFDTAAAGHPPMGVRVFEAGLTNFDTAKEASLNQARRTARSMRRNHARRNARRHAVMRELVRAGLLPTDPAVRESVFLSDAYELRARALDERIEPYELGRILFHLSQRRGFKSNRKSGKAKEDEGILKEIGELAGNIKSTGSRTLGEYLHKLALGCDGPAKVRLRKRHTRRDMYMTEFDSIIAAQTSHHPVLLKSDIVSRIKHFLFFQHDFELSDERRTKEQIHPRANLHRAPSVRACPLEPGQRCCPKGEWIAQRFRILKEVNNLRVSEYSSRERPLKPAERTAVLTRLEAADKVKFDDLRKELVKLGSDPAATFNLERGDRKNLDGNHVEHKLAVAFGRNEWKRLDEGVHHALRDALLHGDDDAQIAQAFREHGAKEDKIAGLLNWNPPDGYVGYSKLALERIVPLLEQGLNEYEAVSAAYPDRQAAKEYDRLPVLDAQDAPLELQDITNPVVRRALVETRKVVNTLIREHGRPARIVVELARNMKEGPEGRKKNSRDNREREKQREEARARVLEFSGNPASRSDVERWLLWQEQGGFCVYTGRSIPPSELFIGGEWEVDHILPRWQSLDDSYMNKVLVHRSANADKGDRTPAQWLGDNDQPFLQMAQRARFRLPYPKFQRLVQRDVEPEQFTARQLNDTRYITISVVRYLQLLYPPTMRSGEKAVQSCRGGLTATLRRNWGLNNILDDILDKDGRPLVYAGRDGSDTKSRADHRHHAVDAVVIAMSTRAVLKQFQDFWKRRDVLHEHPDFPLPWFDFMEDVQAHALRVLVSHRPDRKIRGALHEETFYGPARGSNGDIEEGAYVTRKPLSELKGKSVRNIRDASIRALVEQKLNSAGWDGQSNDLPKDWHIGGLCMPSGVPVRKVRISVNIGDPVQLGHRFAKPGNNHRMEIIEYPSRDGSDRTELKAVVVSMHEAARCARASNRSPHVDSSNSANRSLAVILHRKDTLQLIHPVTGKTCHCIVQLMSGSRTASSTIYLVIRDVRDSRPAAEGNRKPFLLLGSFRPWLDLSMDKIAVDAIGRTQPRAP